MGLTFYIVTYIGFTLVVRMLMFLSIDNGDDMPLIGDISDWSRPRRIAIRLAIFFLWPIWIPVVIVVGLAALLFMMIFSLFK